LRALALARAGDAALEPLAAERALSAGAVFVVVTSLEDARVLVAVGVCVGQAAEYQCGPRRARSQQQDEPSERVTWP
jgi:hypothetical protein